MPGGWWPASSSITTRCGCTRPSATSRRPTSSLGLEAVIHAERDRKLEEARGRRQQMRQAMPAAMAIRQATPKPSATATCRRASAAGLRCLRRQVSIEQVLRHLGYLDPLHGSGPQRRGPCPLHDAPERPAPLLLRPPGQGRLPLLPPASAKRRATPSISGPPITACRSAKLRKPGRNVRPPLDISREIGHREEEPVNLSLSTR